MRRPERVPDDNVLVADADGRRPGSDPRRDPLSAEGLHRVLSGAVELIVVISGDPDSVLTEFGSLEMVRRRVREHQLRVMRYEFVAHRSARDRVSHILVDDLQHTAFADVRVEPGFFLHDLGDGRLRTGCARWGRRSAWGETLPQSGNSGVRQWPDRFLKRIGVDGKAP